VASPFSPGSTGDTCAQFWQHHPHLYYVLHDGFIRRRSAPRNLLCRCTVPVARVPDSSSGRSRRSKFPQESSCVGESNCRRCVQPLLARFFIQCIARHGSVRQRRLMQSLKTTALCLRATWSGHVHKLQTPIAAIALHLEAFRNEVTAFNPVMKACLCMPGT